MSVKLRKKLSKDRRKALEEEELKKKEEEARKEELKKCARVIIRGAFEPMFQKAHDNDRTALSLNFLAEFSDNFTGDEIVVRFTNWKRYNPGFPELYRFKGMGKFKPIELLKAVEDICEEEFGFVKAPSMLFNCPNSSYFKMELEP